MNRILPDGQRGVGVGTLQTHTKTRECESLCLCLRRGKRLKAEGRVGLWKGVSGDDVAEITGAML